MNELMYMIEYVLLFINFNISFNPTIITKIKNSRSREVIEKRIKIK